MIKAQVWSPLRDQTKKPAPAPEPEKPPESLPDATIGWFGALAAMLALWLGDDEARLGTLLGGLPIVVVTQLWRARRLLTWPVGVLWLGGGGALVVGSYMAVTRLPETYHPWDVRILALLGLAGALHSMTNGEPHKLRHWLSFLPIAFLFWVVEYNGAASFVVAFVILAPLVQWLRPNRQANH